MPVNKTSVGVSRLSENFLGEQRRVIKIEMFVHRENFSVNVPVYFQIFRSIKTFTIELSSVNLWSLIVFVSMLQSLPAFIFR